MIEFRRMHGGGDAAHPVRDFKLDPTYATVAKKGDVVKLNGSGNVVAAAAGDTEVLGEFLGPIIKIERDPDTYGKVRTAPNAVYEVTVSGGTPVIGGEYELGLDNGDYFLNVAGTTNPVFKVIGQLSNGNYEAIITARQLA